MNHAAKPSSVQDVFFRIGGAVAEVATTSLIVNSDNTLIDHIWAWRADHGVSPTGWTINKADNGLTVVPFPDHAIEPSSHAAAMADNIQLDDDIDGFRRLDVRPQGHAERLQMTTHTHEVPPEDIPVE